MIPQRLYSKAHDNNLSFIVALDGGAAVGKGALGRELAKKYHLQYFSSGQIYRGLAKLCSENDIDSDNEADVTKLSRVESIIDYSLNLDLNNETIGNIASKIAAYKRVRFNLSKHLTRIINTSHRIIMEGRDIGTVIAPRADLKIFLTASLEVRAERRFKQLKEEGKECIFSQIFDQLKERDRRDSERDVAPMLPAEEAIVIDTSNLTLQEVIEEINDYITRAS